MRQSSLRVILLQEDPLLRGSEELLTPSLSKKTSKRRLATEETVREDTEELEPNDLSPTTLDAKDIYIREYRRTSSSRYSKNHFQTDIERLKASLAEEPPEPIETGSGAHVRFDMVVVHEHPIIVGDNPGGIKGTPMTIAWEAVETLTVPLDQYEDCRAPHRRPMAEMRMKAAHRENVLRNLGFSRTDLQFGAKQATIVRNRRRLTNASTSTDARDEQLEKMRRKVFNVVTLGSRKRKEKAYLKKHVYDVANRTLSASCHNIGVDLSSRSSSREVDMTHHSMDDLPTH